MNVAFHRPIIKCVRCVDVRMFHNFNNDLRFLDDKRVKFGKCATGDPHTGCYRKGLGRCSELAPEIGTGLCYWFLGDLTTMFHVLLFEVTLNSFGVLCWHHK